MNRFARGKTRAVLGGAAFFGVVLVACGGGGGKAATPVSSPTVPSAATPPCEAARRVTPGQAEGAGFQPGSPERASLADASTAGTPLTITGTVLSTDCRPVAGVLLDFWQADAAGSNDAGSSLRGRQTTGDDGRFRLETIVPGVTAGSARQIDVKVRAPGGGVLVTRLYFAGDASNQGDANFDPALAMDVEEEGGARVAGFDFVLAP